MEIVVDVAESRATIGWIKKGEIDIDQQMQTTVKCIIRNHITIQIQRCNSVLSQTKMTTFSHSLTGLLFQRLPQFRPGPPRFSEENYLRIVGVSFYRPNVLPITQQTVSKH